ncbi:MAG: GntR family transcriptional regulator [Firmicutes bacterium]|nr:GntR family transcriptional regulator [Bacillota bacterium]NSW92481.1 GntR family transcriptional regulator [Bacillota bacterium]
MADYSNPFQIKNMQESLTERVYQYLRYSITHQRIKCGERVSITRLADDLQVSQTPVREALQRLEKEMLVEFETNKGVKIIEITPKDVIEICEISMLLECHAIKLSFEVSDINAIIDDLEGCILKQKESYGMQNFDMFMDYALAFHKVFGKHSNNSRLIHTLNSIQGQMDILVAKFYDGSHAMQDSIAEHGRILRAVREHDVEKTVSEMKNHITNSREKIIKLF